MAEVEIISGIVETAEPVRSTGGASAGEKAAVLQTAGEREAAVLDTAGTRDAAALQAAAKREAEILRTHGQRDIN